MKNSILFFIACTALMLSACSSNENLVSLKEYDDLYYQGSEPEFVALNSTTASNAPQIDGATPAEQSYYSNAPYTDNNTPAASQNVAPNEDYYDADYGRRIQNFHNTSNDQAYMYGAQQGFNNGNNWNTSMNIGYGGFGPQSIWGGSVGFGNGFGGYPNYNAFYTSPAYLNMVYSRYAWANSYGNPWRNPWNDPFYSPFNNPYYGGFNTGFGYGFNNGFGYPSFYNPYYGFNPYCPGGFNPFYGPGDFNGNNSSFPTVTETPRSNSTRPSRGGVVGGAGSSGIATQPNPDRTGRDGGVINGVSTAPTRDRSTEYRSATPRSTETARPTPTDREVIAPRQERTTTTRTDYNRSTPRNATQSQQVISPYVRERSTQRDTRSTGYGTATPSRSGENNTRYTQPTRSRSTFDSPSQSSPSFSSPSRSSGGSGGGSSSPSSPSPSRRR